MNTIFQINSDELDEKFVRTIKSLFKNKNLIISISDEIDETDYLLKSKNNAKRLFEALDELAGNKDVTKVNSINELELLIENAKNSAN